MTKESTIRRDQRVPSRWVDGDGVIVSNQRGEATVVNGTGFWLWQRLSEDGCRVGDLVDELATHYKTSSDAIYSDVVQYLERLQQLQLVQVSP